MQSGGDAVRLFLGDFMTHECTCQQQGSIVMQSYLHDDVMPKAVNIAQWGANVPS
jgi:hypothetical protein